MTTSAEYAAGLRELADWIEANPEMPRPGGTLTCYSLNSREEAAACLKALTPCKKDYTESNFYLSREFGPVKLTFMFYRTAVCQRRIVGQRQVGTQVIPARITPEEVIPAHTEDIVEWDCGEPLLAAAPQVEEPVS